MHPEFTSLVDPTGVRIVDSIERTQFDLYTPTAVTPEIAPTERFQFPVETAVRISARALKTDKSLNIYVHEPTRGLVGESTNDSELSLPEGRYDVEVVSTDLKVYVAVESSVEIRRDSTSAEIRFGDQSEIVVGARSFHERPVGTITTTTDVTDMMRAVSYLGSALRTTSPERSFPTLRGHPPLIEVGDNFSVPDVLDRPETGVTIEVPATTESVFVVAPLAYYLGAEVVPGDEPRLVADDFAYDLDDTDDLTTAVRRALQQVFFFDCVTRTEGYYPVELHEREVVEPAVDLDFAALYDAPLAERLRAYLGVPFETVEPRLPEWKVTMDVTPTPENVAVLPFAADELAFVRCPDEPEETEVKPEPEKLTEFYRSADENGSARSAYRSAGEHPDALTNVVQPTPTDSVEHLWVGDGVPVGASKTDAETLRRRFEMSPNDRIEIDVVCNDSEMREEDIVGDIYGTRDLFEFNVSVHNNLLVDEFAALLEEEVDFLHYIGHVSDDGIQCVDGNLDVRDLDSVAVGGFLLNGCRSYTQGQALVDRGSQVGVVTLSKIGNEPAVEVGRELACFLNHGFSVQGSLGLLQDETIPSSRYIVVGDGSQALVKPKCGATVMELKNDEEPYEVEIRTYPTSNIPMGCIFTTKADDRDKHYISSGTIGTFRIDAGKLDQMSNYDDFLLKHGSKIYYEDTFIFDRL